MLRVGHPVTQPLGQSGSSLGGSGVWPKLHWHSCVSKLGLTESGSPKPSVKKDCAGSLQMLRHMPLHELSCKNLHFSTTKPPNCPSSRRLIVEGPTRKPKKVGVTNEVRAGA
eukprot:CAMPEP_0182603890 /NCGR_PEP_ID=MMETSP1324-20130603/92720_1 /TAXON_ID=236786 /ORGANISM="Florenciella sp., Strain RCC1587" /LENGTH=111 /DNA_ID=CAMNT_0024821821 /DNA_START=113 /DNA_END=448 /DNA_ORIENTATION=-